MGLFNISDERIAAMGARNCHNGLDGIPDSQDCKPGLHPVFCGECKTGLALTYYVVDATKVRQMQILACVNHNHVLAC